MRRHLGILSAVAALMVAQSLGVLAFGQTSPWSVGPLKVPEDPTIKIVLYPATAPRPALRYQLLPPFLDRRPGNAAVHYLKVPHERIALFSNEEFWKTMERWRQMPLPELRQDAQGHKYASFITSPQIFEQLERGARCDSCDWDLPIREQDAWSILLPDIQSARAPARILAARARLQIADGEYDEAVHTLQVGYALGRHVSQGPTIIQSLVGCAIAASMSKQVETFIQQPDAPNLYWALTTLPRPLIDFRPGFEGEMASFYLSCPELRDLDKKNYSPEQWCALLQKTEDKLIRYMDVCSSAGPKTDETLAKTGFMALMINGYPRAKQHLIDQGRSAAEVEAMPAAQVILLDAMQTYDELRDNMFKWTCLPYAEARKGMEQAHHEMREVGRSMREVLPIASLLLPATTAARAAEARTDRAIAALRVLEAIRLYAAAHGRLPEKLGDITDVPVPNDPLRGEPFVYRWEESSAVLESPSQLSHLVLRYQIRLEGLQRKGEQP